MIAQLETVNARPIGEGEDDEGGRACGCLERYPRPVYDDAGSARGSMTNAGQWIEAMHEVILERVDTINAGKTAVAT